ncbi:MAG: topoisomerase DNA-binding C4 zinc finger domain-containing protein [Thermosediminibacteraceae bacterium]|nr:topoisomerase DNA-binding C4 zinc finger domain-containing protein [Thermosediminibacteraceae bacterium]
MRTDQLRAFIDKSKSFSCQKNLPSPTSIIHEIVKYHKPAAIDIYKRYNIDPKETMPMKERIKFDITKRVYICVFCNNQMVLQKNRNGLFWGCSNYPQCKNLVPAGVAAQVGKETREEYVRKQNFFTALFSSPPKLCPVCGNVLELKKGRKGEYWECSSKQLCNYKKW